MEKKQTEGQTTFYKTIHKNLKPDDLPLKRGLMSMFTFELSDLSYIHFFNLQIVISTIHILFVRYRGIYLCTSCHFINFKNSDRVKRSEQKDS